MKTQTLLFLLITPFLILAQHKKPLDGNKSTCGVNTTYKELIKDQLQSALMQRAFTEGEKLMQNNNKSMLSKATIPIVFHIIYDGSPNILNINESVIQAQLDQLNEDFNGTGIDFCIAEKLNGQPLTPANAVAPIGTTVLGASLINVIQGTSEPAFSFLVLTGLLTQ